MFLPCLALESVRLWSPPPTRGVSLHYMAGQCSKAPALLPGELQVLDVSTAGFMLG